jgi:alpha-tubulin suppressor-like RCC1 family protein
MNLSRLPVAALLLAALVGCRDDVPSATEPETAPAPAVAATAAPLSFIQISAGADHACGVAADNKAWCWGGNQYGQLGIPIASSPHQCSSQPCALRPVAVSGGLRFRQVDAAGPVTCGVTTGDEVFCWGNNGAGQLGIGTTLPSSTTPLKVAGGRTYRLVKAGTGNLVCAISMARDAYCWGAGYLGNGVNGTRRSPVKVTGTQDWLDLGVGTNHTCAITTANLAWCWGTNNLGQLGNGTTTASSTPVRSAQGFAFAHIDAGALTTCGVLTDARAVCWGSSTATGDGRGEGRKTLTPVALGGTRKWSNVTLSYLDGCGVTLAGAGFCWGKGTAGELGYGSAADRFSPVSVAGNIAFLSISPGFAFSCGVATGGKGWCWGDGTNGQLGNGGEVGKLTPVAVAAP